MTVQGIACALLTSAGIAACAPSADQAPVPLAADFPFAVYHRDCAPWDGPALSFVFSSEPGDTASSSYPDPHHPFLRIATYRPPADLPGHSFDWTGTDHNFGYAELCRADGDCEAAHAVEVEFGNRARDGRVGGELTVRFQDGSVISGPFEAEEVPVTFMCG